MALQEKLTEDLKQSMRDKNSLKSDTIRNIKAQVKYYQIEKKLEAVSDEDILTVIQKLSKQRKDSIAQFDNAGRTDLSEKEKAELLILETYLPKQLTEEELKTLVLSVKTELNITEKKDMGRLIKEVMQKCAGAADGKVVSALVKDVL